MSALPLGALRRALHALARSDDRESTDPNAFTIPSPKGKDGEEVTSESHWSLKPRNLNAKRSNKHAYVVGRFIRLSFFDHSFRPVEVTSKRPVSRRRNVTEVKTLVTLLIRSCAASSFKVCYPQRPRDPRFLPLTGEFSAQKFRTQYSFLSEIHANELKTLRDNLTRARGLMKSSPRDLCAKREQEVARLELAVKRAESAVNKERIDKVEHEALSKVVKEEQAQRKLGKGRWWMKQGQLLLVSFDKC